MTGRGPSSQANARDLRKISPFGRNDKESFFPNLASLRLGGRNDRIRAFLAPGKFAQAAKTLSYSNAKGQAPDARSKEHGAWSKRDELRAGQKYLELLDEEEIGKTVSLAKTQRR